jgi:hypothetical protein
MKINHSLNQPMIHMIPTKIIKIAIAFKLQDLRHFLKILPEKYFLACVDKMNKTLPIAMYAVERRTCNTY